MNSPHQNQDRPSEDDFIRRVRSAVYRGYSFVPLIGSGVSADSGILTGEQFTGYLAWTVFRCVALDNEQPDKKRWDLKRYGWPQDTPDLERARTWIARHFLDIAESTHFPNANTLIDRKYHDRTDGHPSAFSKISKFKKPKSEEEPLPEQLKNLLQPLNWPLVPQILATNDGFQHNQNVFAIGRTLNMLDILRDYQAPQGVPQTSPRFILEKAIRSLHDWRATLIFLAALTLEKTGECQPRLVLHQPDNCIIDWFNAHLTTGRKPNLAHNMLAHLARPLRFRTILSTNFDTLLEEAFHEFNHQLHTFPVSIKSGLPDARTVRSQNSIIKLHGELTDTRADFSLDDKPAEADTATFLSYLSSDLAGNPHTVGNHILLAGVSGRDMRIVHFLQRALEAIDSLRLFWICYNTDDIDRVRTLFKEDFSEKVCLVQTKRLDLLLYEIYQKCTLSLPPGGFSFTFTHQVPPRRQDSSIKSSSHNLHRMWAKRIRSYKEITDQYKEHGRSHAELIRTNDGYYSLEGVHVIDHANILVDRLEDIPLNCIWLEMADFATPYALLHEVFVTIALRRGFFQLQHAEFLPADFTDPRSFSRLRVLIDILGIRPEDWVLLLYGRSVPGASSGWIGNAWGETQYDEFHRMLRHLGCATDPNSHASTGLQFRIVYMPFTDERYFHERRLDQKVLAELRSKCGVAQATSVKSINRDTDFEGEFSALYKKLAEKLKSGGQAFLDFHSLSKWSITSSANIDEGFDSNIGENKTKDAPRALPHIINHWLYPSKPPPVGSNVSVSQADVLTRRRGLQFLYGLLLFRQSRHPNAVLTDAVFRCPCRFNNKRQDNDWIRSEITNEWMTILKDENAFLNKPGGYAWIYRDLRLSVLRLIETQVGMEFDDGGKLKRFEFLGQLRGRMHDWIGDWYFKAFCATGHITPLFESFYHRFQSMAYIRFDKRGGLDLRSSSDLAVILRSRFLGYHKALNLLLKALHLSKPWLQYWLSEASTVEGMQLPMGGTLPELEDSLFTQFEAIGGGSEDLRNFRERVRFLQKEAQEIITETVEAVRTGSRGGPITRHSAYEHVYLTRHPKSSNEFETPNPPTRYSFNIEALQRPDFRAAILSSLESNAFCCFSPSALELGPERRIEEPLNTNLSERVAQLRRQWIWGHVSDQRSLWMVGQLLSEYAYLHAKRAKLESHARMKSTDRWLEVCMICYEQLALCAHLDASYLPSSILLETKCLTLYGLALGHLGRYFEAHRRLNEAEALLAKASLLADPLELAKIKLRRAEVYLLSADEAALIRPTEDTLSKRESEGLLKEMLTTYPGDPSDFKGDTIRLHAALIDDAWILLEEAQQLIAGKSHSSLWWSRWLTLSLRCYGASRECEYDTLPFIRAINARAKILRLFEMSRLISDSDCYRQLRFIDYCYFAISAAFKKSGGSQFNHENDVKTLRDLHSELLKRFQGPVLAEGTLLLKYSSDVAWKLDLYDT